MERGRKEMIVTNGKWNAISNPDCCVVNGSTIYVSKENYEDIILYIQTQLHIERGQVLNIDKIPTDCSICGTLLLVAIGLLNRCVYCEQERKKMEITFSYNFPIAIETDFINRNLDNVELFTNANLISLGECGDFLRVEINDERKYSAFMSRNRYLINKNDKEIRIIYDLPLKDILLKWQEYCLRKFNVAYSEQVIQAYLKVYSDQGFRTQTYVMDGIIIAQGVTYRSLQSDTLYYCIFWWDEIYKSKSPGIYAYCKAVQECYQNGVAFSFCYGCQEYKSKLLREFIK